MEPPAEVLILEILPKNQQTNLSCRLAINAAAIYLTNCFCVTNCNSAHAIRIRGGAGDTINVDKNSNVIPYLSTMRFSYNGLPQIDFETKTLNPFKNGLGSITLDKNTLLQTAEQTDTCGRRSAITYAAGTPDQQSGHDQRVTKLFHCLLNYIDTRSCLYIFLMEHVQPNGVVAWSYIISFGRCPIPLPITFARNDAWQMLTMDSKCVLTTPSTRCSSGQR